MPRIDSPASNISNACPATQPRTTSLVARKIDNHRPILRNAEDLARVGILYFSAGRESFHVNEFAGRERTFYDVGFARDRDPIRVIALGYFCSRRGGGRRRVFRRGSCILRRRSGVWIERLLARRILCRALLRISRGALTNALRRFVHLGTGSEQKSSKQHERQRKFHKIKSDEVISLLIQCQSLNGVALRSTIDGLKTNSALFQR